MRPPTIIFGKSANTLWHDCANGDLLLSVDGHRLLLHRAPDTGLFHFDHDSLVEGVQCGYVQDAVQDLAGTLQSFRIGPMFFRVEDWFADRDVYVCRPMSSAAPRSTVSLSARCMRPAASLN